MTDLLKRRDRISMVRSRSLRLHLARLAQLENWRLDELCAPHWRLYIGVTPGGRIGVEGRTVPIAPGTGLLIPPLTSCSATSDGPFCKAYVHFDYEEDGRMARPGLYSFASEPETHSALQELAADSGADLSNGVVDGEPVDALVQILVREIMRALAQRREDCLVPAPAYAPEVVMAITLLESALDRPLSNETLADRCGMHPNSLIRRFTRQVGCSPQRYGRQVRLKLAAELLLTTDLTIDAIAARVGFPDRNHFTRAFQKQWRIPPAAYRRLYD